MLFVLGKFLESIEEKLSETYPYERFAAGRPSSNTMWPLQELVAGRTMSFSTWYVY